MQAWMAVELRRQAEDFFRNGRKDAHNRQPLRTDMHQVRIRRARRRVRRSLRSLCRALDFAGGSGYRGYVR